MFARIEVWLVLVLALLGLMGTILFGNIVLDRARGEKRLGEIATVAVTLAEVPDTMEAILQGEDRMVVSRHDRFDDPSGWTFTEPATGPGLPGYWLLSRYDPAARQSIVEMVRLSDAKVMHVWRPSPDELLADARRTTKVAHTGNWTNDSFRYFAPSLMPDGGLLLKDSASPLIRVNACAQKEWMQDSTLFHHSTESDGAGGFWIPSIIEPSQIPFVAEDFADDGLAHVSADGTVLQQISVAEILMRHGMQHLVFPPLVDNKDPLHLNDIEPVLQDGPFWKAGDLFISLRHPSMILLYRPATDEILWMQQGPWMAQHDVDILDDHRISVFDNRTYYRGTYGRVDGTSDVVVYDFATQSATRPHHDAIAAENLRVLFEGVYAALPGGSFLIEDQTAGAVLAFAPDGRKIAQFVNGHDDGQVYQIGWGRYVDQSVGDDILKTIEGIDCDA